MGGGAAMSKAVVNAVAFGLLASLTSLAIAEKTPRPRRAPNRDGGKVASIDEPDFTRFRVVTEQGILAVFDADEEWDGRDEPASQLAYWNDFASDQLFFFDRLLYTGPDVSQALAALQLDLNINLAQILSEKAEFDPLPEPTGVGLWRPATEIDVLTVMTGGTLGAREGGEVSGLNSPCAPGTCPDPEALAMSDSLPAPIRGTRSSGLFVMAQSGSDCTCGGGGGCSSCLCCPAFSSQDDSDSSDGSAAACCGSGACTDCNPCTVNDLCGASNSLGCGTTAYECCGQPIVCPDDGNPCTRNAGCQNGECRYPTLTCGDGNRCTNDSCNLASGCVNTPKNCDDGQVCTADSCNASTGACVNAPFCSSTKCCPYDDGFICCDAAG
jgi:hypothetical protein